MTNVSDLYPEHVEDLGEEWHPVFDALTSQGKSPSGIRATIEYVTSGKTQQEVSHEYGVSEVTIRNLQAAVIALGPVDDSTVVSPGTGTQATAMDLCTHISDVLGWEEGVEYRAQENPGGTQQPSLLKAGWLSLHDHFVDDD